MREKNDEMWNSFFYSSIIIDWHHCIKWLQILISQIPYYLDDPSLSQILRENRNEDFIYIYFIHV